MKNMLMSSVLALGLMLSVTEANAVTYYYLGGAYSLDHCCDLAQSGGYDRCTFGGYINGIYYYNACFGSYKNGSGGGSSSGGSSFSKWENAIRFVSIDTSTLSTDITLYAPGYKVIEAELEAFRSAVKTLEAAGEDGVSGQTVRQFYNDLKDKYTTLASKYYPVHQQLQNATIEKAWRSLAEAMQRLDREIQF